MPTIEFPRPSAPVDPDELVRVSAQVQQLRRALGEAFDALELPPSSQEAARAANLARELHEVDAAFGLLTGQEVAKLVGSRDTRGSWARDRRRAGKLIGFMRAGQYVYPGYQFDSSGEVFDAIPEIVKRAREYDVSDHDLALWMASRSRTLDDRRPVDFLAGAGGLARIEEALGAAFGVEW